MDKNFFQYIMDFLFGRTETVKKNRVLKKSAALLYKKGFPYYIYRKDVLTPAFAAFLYELYGASAGMRAVFDTVKTTDRLVYAVLRFSVPESVSAALDAVDENQIRLAAADMSYRELYSLVKEQTEIIRRFFTLDEFDTINSVYEKILRCRMFCMFDYYAVLRKFDADLTENSFSERAVFHSEYGISLADSLSDLASAASAFAGTDGLETVFAFLHRLNTDADLRESDVVRVWNMLRLHEQNHVFTVLCRCVRRNDAYVPPDAGVPHNAVGKWLNGVFGRAGETLHAVYDEQRKQRVEGGVRSVFGDAPQYLLKQYTTQLGARLQERKFGYFKYTEPLNCVYVFLKLPVMKQFDQFIRVLTIRGIPGAPDSLTQLFDIYHGLTDLPAAIEALDAKLAPGFQPGYEFDSVLKKKAVPDDMQIAVVRDIDLVNAEAAGMIRSCMNCLSQLVKFMQQLSDDVSGGQSVLVTNWYQVERMLNASAKDMIESCSVKMKQMNRLLEELVAGSSDNPVSETSAGGDSDSSL